VSLLVVIPAFNEEDSIGNVIQDIRIHIPSASILVVDDGSKDNTVKVAESTKVNVLSLPFNVGVGGALRAGFLYAHRNSFTQVLQIDADGQHKAEHAKILLESGDGFDIVIGSRFAESKNGYNASILRRLAIRLLSVAISKICKTKLTDVTSGFRLSSSSAIELFMKDYPVEYLGDTVESLVIAHKSGLSIKEVPVQMSKREFGSPSQNVLKSSWYLLRAFLVIILSLIHRK
jgi:glycosyltransferase involved in cell wall biosynthesis